MEPTRRSNSKIDAEMIKKMELDCKVIQIALSRCPFISRKG